MGIELLHLSSLGIANRTFRIREFDLVGPFLPDAERGYAVESERQFNDMTVMVRGVPREGAYSNASATSATPLTWTSTRLTAG